MRPTWLTPASRMGTHRKANPRVEVTVAPVSAPMLALLEHETGLGFTTATLTVGQQGKLEL